MLVRLVIRNFAIIDDLTIEFGQGLSAITGETGAGKSILIDALGAVLGDRTSSDSVRTDSARSTIDAEFSFDHTPRELAGFLAEVGIEDADGVLLLTREIQSNGRSSARVNGRPVTAGVLARIGANLVDIHGQSEHMSLLSRTRQRETLDAFGVDPNLLRRMRDGAREWRAARQVVDELLANERAIAQRIDLLHYQVGDISAVDPRNDEDRDLSVEFGRLSQVDRLLTQVAAAQQLIDAENDPSGAAGALVQLRSALKHFEDSKAIDASLETTVTSLQDVVFNLEDVLLNVRRYLDGLEADPARLEWVSERLARLNDIKRKYGQTLSDVISYADAAVQELQRLTGQEFDLETARSRERELFSQAEQWATALTKARKSAARKLQEDANDAMRDLQLGTASLTIEVTPTQGVRDISNEANPIVPAEMSFDESGADTVQFLFAPNTGETPRPLARIASGGEMARIMLALKAVIASTDPTPTLVFDEVDVGVGGRSGRMVGEKLRQLANKRQVIVISHLPQVAAFADWHHSIRKVERDSRTFSTVVQLDEQGRLHELAAMIDGEPVTERSLAKAAEMSGRSQATQRLQAR
ncbi:DNA repair protein RecN [soil metagenome]